MKNIFRYNKKNFLIIILIVSGGVSVGITYAVGTVETFTAPWQLQDSSNGATRIYVDSSGNVGIGTTTPAVRLDVNAGGDVDAIRIHGASSSQYTFISQIYNNGVNPYARLGCWTGSSACNTVIDLGNVGIGTTTPQNKLDVNGGLAVGSYAGTNSAPNNGVIISGKVGIGTSTPKNILNVLGDFNATTNSGGDQLVTFATSTANRAARLQLSGTIAGYNSIYSGTSGTEDWRIGENAGGSGGYFAIYTGPSATEQMRIISNGNVGIGTNNPAQKLEVNGMIQDDGNLTTSSTNKEFKISAPSGVPICIGTGC